MKLFYNSDGTAKVLPVSSLPANTVWNGGFPYTPEGSLLVSIVSAKPTDTVSNGGFIQELWGGVCAGYDTPSIWIGGLAITSYGALCLDVDGGIATDGPVLYNSLTHSLIPTRGSLTPTFTRATTETGQKWDEAGYLDFTALAGEAVFTGARRERNLVATTSQDFSNAAWTKVSTTVVVNQAIAPDGTLTADLVHPASTGADRVVYQNGLVSLVIGSTALLVIRAKYAGIRWLWFGTLGGGTTPAQLPFFDLQNGVAGQAGTYFDAVSMEDLGDGWYECAATKNSLPAAPLFPIYGLGDADGSTTVTANGTDGFYLWASQINDITGETDQTTIRPYVSVGAPTDWAGDDLVTNGTFDTDTTWIKESGWTISGGVATHAAGVSATLYQGFNFVAGATYVFSWDTVISAGAVSLRVGGGYLIPIDFKSASGTYTATYTAVTTATDLLGFVCDASFAGTIDNFSVKPAIYHGSMVDGVKCYDTDRSGNPISTSGSYPIVGYVPWEARTNLCLQSNAFTTTWTANGTPAATQNVIGPDGGTTGWTLTDNNAAGIEGVNQTIALTAATYTYSVFVNKTTGAQSSYPVITTDNGVSRIAACTVDTTNGVATVWTAYTGLTVQTSSATCVSHNENYWRVSLTFLATAENWTHYLIVAATTNATQSTGSFDPTAQGSAVFYGAQVELGSFATPYQPTTTFAVARNADVDQYPTTAGPIAAAGSIALDFTPYHAPSGTIALWGTYVDASNYTAILHDATNLIFRKRIAGSNYDATIANAFVSGTTYKVAATWGAAGTAIYLDGVAGTPHANTTAAQIAATMQVGADGNSLQQPGAGTTNLRIWQRQLSSPEGVAVTA